MTTKNSVHLTMMMMSISECQVQSRYTRSSDYIYVADSTTDSISVFDDNGNFKFNFDDDGSNGNEFQESGRNDN